LLEPDSVKRITIEELFNHPWIIKNEEEYFKEQEQELQEEEQAQKELKELKELKEQNEQKKLKELKEQKDLENKQLEQPITEEKRITVIDQNMKDKLKELFTNNKSNKEENDQVNDDNECKQNEKEINTGNSNRDTTCIMEDDLKTSINEVKNSASTKNMTHNLSTDSNSIKLIDTTISNFNMNLMDNMIQEKESKNNI
jgi:hypothetical protein